MNKLKNHIQSVASLHAKRKHRTNTSTKYHLPEFRAIAWKSNVHNELTVVDAHGNTVVQMFDKDAKGKKLDNAFELWKKVAWLLLGKGVSSVVFDRNGFRFIGRIKALADGLIEWWIKI